MKVDRVETRPLTLRPERPIGSALGQLHSFGCILVTVHADGLTGQNLVIDRDTLPDTDDEDEFYHADLIGLPVTDGEGNAIGSILEIHNHGAGDLLVIRPVAGGATLLLPFTKVAVPVLDVPNGRVVIDPAFLAGPEKPPADAEA